MSQCGQARGTITTHFGNEICYKQYWNTWKRTAPDLNSGGSYTLTRWPRSSMPSLTLEWIIVTPSWSVHQGQQRTNYSGRWTLLCVITGTRKFDRGVGQILHDQLHWLDVPDRVVFKLAVTVHRCLNGRAPPLSVGALHPGLQCWHAAASALPTVTYLPYRVSGSTLTAVGRFQLLAWWPGTHSWILSGIQRAAQTVLGVYSRVTSASSALAVLDAIQIYAHTHHSLKPKAICGNVWWSALFVCWLTHISYATEYW